MIKKIISGGQTGVDRAALDWGIENKYAIGGWCPFQRLAEDGIIPLKYPLQETPSPNYEQRTEWNIHDSDGTLVIIFDKATGGIAYTIKIANQVKKPLLIINLCDDNSKEVLKIHQWLNQYNIQTLNIAGPRESKENGIYSNTKIFLQKLF